jgi:hypothetical protein
VTGIPTDCTICGTELLNRHNLIGACLECKLILRNERLTNTEHEQLDRLHRKELDP